ncbi:hypothetical protein VFPPC_18268 [Pochonia chlamydosporia 170]|uniref:Uncharacterized protein n=1 Tax=Pochonia chlamydosporia 170 TaxID=1380566 RepID=A0A219AP27_METCM|nr:hypothetical protein VFPPC_18268 [Pochonia chlamydosporia 170]OWT42600.1 hypothetical protein VFPPC_18268 [Pochonia chlamydosporia 170]
MLHSQDQWTSFPYNGQAAADVDHMDQYLGSMPMGAQDMGLDFASSSISNDTLVGQGFYTGNEYYQHSSHSSHSHHESSSNGHSSPWDATTVWSDGPSSVPDPVMLDELAMDSTWTQNMFDPSICMDAYGEHNMTYYNQGVQPAQQYGRSGKSHGRPTSISY